MPNNRIKLAGYFLAALAIFALAGYGFYFFYSTIQSESEKLAEAEKKIAALEKKDKEFNDAVKDLAEFEEKIAILRSAFVSEATFVSYLESIEALGRNAGVDFEAISANFEAAAEEPAIFTFMVSGRTEELINFFTLLDNLPQAGLLEKVSISPTAATGGASARATYLIFNRVKQQ